ncbi:MAG: acyl carrier protein [Clostridia bacterium]|nr:acyl carrier protein [Clostridia bacterium]
MFERVKEILIEEMQVSEDLITNDAELVNDLGVNSLELADLILLCEEKFDIEINDEDIHKFVTVGDVVAYLAQQTGEDA